MSTFTGRPYAGVAFDEYPVERTQRVERQRWHVGDFVFAKGVGYSFVAETHTMGTRRGYKLVNATTHKTVVVYQDKVRPPGRRRPTDREIARYMQWMLMGDDDGSNGQKN